ncbi:Panacea domain-containing protein [Macrococcus brunensis]|uniref:Panacea domain-containing protein n=1 Tax=Macrococcus brunensis TaxID=198483 RepID=UPI001EEFEE83|nr:type II toxin-antitoxin system antitoxin SocA domain-containing protein [Macrococcus brunensis]ULG71164.1 DUF4065 domain-containing protein [Macrococcus brunensis]
MASIHEVANYIIENGTNITPKKLQKLTYYAEAWHNALLDSPLVDDSHFEAWVHGPVSPELYSTYRAYGWNVIGDTEHQTEKTLSNEQIELIDSVLETYDELSGNELEALTHSERPWLNKRVGLEEMDASRNIISTDDMREYYKSIYIGD